MQVCSECDVQVCGLKASDTPIANRCGCPAHNAWTEIHEVWRTIHDNGGFRASPSPRVGIGNEAAAAHFWPGQETIGKRLHFFGDSNAAEVIGVARNANYQTIGEAPQALIYLSLIQYYFPTAVVWVRTSGDPEAAALAVRHGMQTLDRNLLLQSESVERTIRESLGAERLSAGDITVVCGPPRWLCTLWGFGGGCPLR